MSVFTADDKEQTAFEVQMACGHITFSCDPDSLYTLWPGSVLQWNNSKELPERRLGFHSKKKAKQNILYRGKLTFLPMIPLTFCSAFKEPGLMAGGLESCYHL